MLQIISSFSVISDNISPRITRLVFGCLAGGQWDTDSVTHSSLVGKNRIWWHYPWAENNSCRTLPTFIDA